MVVADEDLRHGAPAAGAREHRIPLGRVPVDLDLARPFQRDVLKALRDRVGYGERTTYAALAEASGHTGASRAVGTALGGNPLCVVVPCHRVLPASGGIGGYAGGTAAKEYLLGLEERRQAAEQV